MRVAMGGVSHDKSMCGDGGWRGKDVGVCRFTRMIPGGIIYVFMV